MFQEKAAESIKPIKPTEPIQNETQLEINNVSARAELKQEIEQNSQEEKFGEMMIKEGVNITPEEARQLYDAVPDLVADTSPELSEYLKGMGPRLSAIIKKSADLNSAGQEPEAVEAALEFIETEQEHINKIKDPAIQDRINALLASSLDARGLAEKMKKQTVKDGVWDVASMVPVAGSMLEIGEGTYGKTASGRTLSTGSRAYHIAAGTAFLALDVAGLATAGGATAAAEAGKAAKISGTAAKGAKMAATIAKLAGYCNKIKNLGKVAVSVEKLGVFIGKHPESAAHIASYIEGKARSHSRKVGVK